MAWDVSKLNEAVALLDGDSYEQALEAYRNLWCENLTSFEQCVVLLSEKKCSEFLGRLDEAEQTLRRIQQLDKSGEFQIFLESGSVDLLFAKGEYHEFLKRGNALLKRYREELKQPEYENVLHNLQMNIPFALISLGKSKEGAAGLRRFLPQAREEDRPHVHLFLGIAYARLGKPNAAIEQFKTILSLGTNENALAEAHYRLGALYAQDKSLEQAKEHFLAAEKLKHALGNTPLRDLYIFLANTSGQIGEENARRRYLQLANTN